MVEMPFTHPIIDVITSPGNAAIAKDKTLGAYDRLTAREKYTLNDAYRFARAESGLPDAAIEPHIQEEYPGAVQALLAVYMCRAEVEALRRFRFRETGYYRTGHSYGYFVQSLLALQTSTFITTAASAYRGLTQTLPGREHARVHAHLLNVRDCTMEETLSTLNTLAGKLVYLVVPDGWSTFFPAIRNVGGSVTFCSWVPVTPKLVEGLDKEYTIFPHPPYHHPVLMAEARDRVYSFLTSHLDTTGDVPGNVRMLSGMNGRLEEIGPSRLDIMCRAADEVCHWIDWTTVVGSFGKDGGELDRHVLSYGISEMTDRRDPVRLVSGGRNAPGKWHFQAT